MDKIYIISLMAVVFILIITNITAVVYINKNHKKLNKIVKQYDEALSKFNSTENINDEFISIYTRLGMAEKISEESIKKYNELLQENKSKISKIGLVKYDAYDDTENKLSYALAIMDSELNGIVINHVHSKHGDNSYIKEVINGKTESRITQEEAQAIKEAGLKEN